MNLGRQRDYHDRKLRKLSYKTKTNKNVCKLVDDQGYPHTPEYEIIKSLFCGRILFRKDGLYGYMDKKFNVAINPKYKEARNFSEDLAVVLLDNGNYSYIRIDGSLVGHEYRDAHRFKKGVADVRLLNGISGVIDTTFQWLVTK